MRPPSRPRRALAVAAAAALTLVAVACGTSGRELREPNRAAVAPTRSTASSSASTQAPTAVQLVSDDFAPGAAIPADHGCGTSPPALRWFGIPKGTAEVALALVDFDESDAGRRVRWLVRGLPGSDGSSPAGATLPEGAVALTNGEGTTGYAGPCPPAGKNHTYNFMVFALKQPSQLTPAASAADALSELEAGAVNDIAYYTGTVAG